MKRNLNLSLLQMRFGAQDCCRLLQFSVCLWWSVPSGTCTALCVHYQLAVSCGTEGSQKSSVCPLLSPPDNKTIMNDKFFKFVNCSPQLYCVSLAFSTLVDYNFNISQLWSEGDFIPRQKWLYLWWLSHFNVHCFLSRHKRRLISRF